jgi:hypothetical protein
MQLLLYKKKIFRNWMGVDKTAKNRKTTLKNNISSNNNETVYKVQLLAASKKVPLISSKGLSDISSTFDGEIYDICTEKHLASKS